jgi:hypothetical protein
LREVQAYSREIMSPEELEVEVLKLPFGDRARLGERLLQSLENLSEEENAELWAEEANRRDQAWDARATAGLPGDVVFGPYGPA